jgi:hypothetical protein
MLRVWHRDMQAGGPLITDGEGRKGIARAIYRIEGLESNPKQASANADRLVACWNACVGLSTKDLETIAASMGEDGKPSAVNRLSWLSAMAGKVSRELERGTGIEA